MDTNNSKVTGLIIKLLFAIGITAFMIWKTPFHTTSSTDTLITILMIIASVYVLISIYSLMLHACGNYLLAIILTAIVIIVLAYASGTLRKKGLLTVKGSYYVGLAVGILLAAFDIVRVLRHFILAHRFKSIQKNNTLMHTGTGDLKQHMKEDPQMFLNMANALEQQLGRKPSSDEVMNFIDSSDIDDYEHAKQICSRRD